MPINFKAGTVQTNVTNNWTARQVFSGDAVFGSGHPWLDVRAFGAVGDGVTDDTAAFAACWGALASQPFAQGTIYISPGSYLVSSLPTLTGRNYSSIVGAGQASRIIANNTGTITDFMRIVNSFYFTLRDFHMAAQGTSTITHMINYTATTAAEILNAYNIVILPAQKAQYGFAIGADTVLDTSEVQLFGIVSSGATVADFRFGDLAAGSNDVLEIQCHGCVAYGTSGTDYGVLSDGGFTWTGGFVGFHDVADFKQIDPGSTPLYIDGVESQNSKRFLEFFPSSTDRGTPITLVGVNANQFTDVDGKVLKIRSTIPVNLLGCQFSGLNHVTAFELAGCAVTATGMITDAQNPFSLAESDVKWNWQYPRRVSDADTTNVRAVNQPTIAAGAALGASPTVDINGTDTQGRIILTAGASGTTTGDLCTVTFSAALPSLNRPRVQITPANANSSALTAYYLNEPGSDNTKFIISTNTAPTATLQYYFTYTMDPA